ncbi:MAG: hypothetical protein ACE5IR_04415 [bacterium]
MPRNLTRREKILTGAAFVSASVFLLTKFVFFPIVNDWRQTELDIAATQVRYLSTLKIARTSHSLLQKKQANTDKLANSARVAEFLKEIQSAAGQRVAIHRFLPLQAREPNSSNRYQMKKNLTTLQVQIECLGNLPDLLAFFERLETGDRLTRIRHFYLTPGGGERERLQCQLILVRMVTT